jgi:hypothetical protein
MTQRQLSQLQGLVKVFITLTNALHLDASTKQFLGFVMADIVSQSRSQQADSQAFAFLNQSLKSVPGAYRDWPDANQCRIVLEDLVASGMAENNDAITETLFLLNRCDRL